MQTLAKIGGVILSIGVAVCITMYVYGGTPKTEGKNPQAKIGETFLGETKNAKHRIFARISSAHENELVVTVIYREVGDDHHIHVWATVDELQDQALQLAHTYFGRQGWKIQSVGYGPKNDPKTIWMDAYLLTYHKK
jgi:hypothetical protein